MGVIYLGLMITKTGPKLVEYNCRFGDPEEAQVLLPRLNSDLLAAAAGGAGRHIDIKSHSDWQGEVALTVVMASKGYPGAYEKGHEYFRSGNDAPQPARHHDFSRRNRKEETARSWLWADECWMSLPPGRPLRPRRGQRAYAAVEKISWEGSVVIAAILVGGRSNLLDFKRAARRGNQNLCCSWPDGPDRAWAGRPVWWTVPWPISSMTMSAPRAHKFLDGITHYEPQPSPERQ